MKRAGIVVRILIIIVSVMMILWCVNSRIINIGSVTGVAVFAVVGICAAFWSKISAWLRKIRKKNGLKVLTNIAAVLLGLAVLYVGTVLCLMTAFALRAPAEEATLVVLGCQVNGRNPSLMLRRRIDAAYEYLVSHPQAKCVLSGGQGSNELISEAQCMYECLTEKGIAGDRLLKEDKSSNTEENIRFSCRLIEEQHLNPELAIVTDGFHEFRAAMIVESNGYHCGAVPAATPLYLAANFTIREVLAVTARFMGFSNG